MKKKADKQKDLEALRKDWRSAQNLFVTGYEKLKVEQDFELRKTVRGAGGSTGSSRTTSPRRRREGTPAEAGAEGLKGMTLAGLHDRRSGGAGKGADRVRQDEPGVHFQGGHGRRPGRSTSRASTIWRRMPSKEEIFAKLLFLINAPAQRLVTAMNARRPQPGGGDGSGRQGEQVSG